MDKVIFLLPYLCEIHIPYWTIPFFVIFDNGKLFNALDAKIVNSKVGFRFVTKFGEKGVVNLGKVVPVLGGVIGGTLDVASTKIIGNNVYKIFIKGEIPTNKKEDMIIKDAEFTEVEDIDTKSLEEAMKSLS